MSGERARRTPSGRTLRLVTGTDDATDVAPDEREGGSHPTGLGARADATAPGGPDTPDSRITVPVERRSVAVGRHWVVRTVAERGVVGMANQVVELLSSELLANAVLHGPQDGEITVAVTFGPGTVRVAVGDRGRRTPVVLHGEPAAPAGRGMAIVEAMSNRWGVLETDDGGKTVWFELDLDAY